jgi:hypothetical protein
MNGGGFQQQQSGGGGFSGGGGGGGGGFSSGRRGGRGSGSFRGRGRGQGRGNSSGGGAGAGGGGGQQGGQGGAGAATGEPSLHNLCFYFVKDGSCRYGNTCRNSHAVSNIMCMPAHQSPVKSIGILQSPDATRLLTGSQDASVKVNNLEIETLRAYIMCARGI